MYRTLTQQNPILRLLFITDFNIILQTMTCYYKSPVPFTVPTTFFYIQ
jgi:hypothetical protein